MKTVIIALIVTLLPALSFGQENKKSSPDEKISVQKDFDEDGNLIRYDSTYTFQWFSDSIPNLDFMLKFQESFGSSFPFGGFSLNDSLFQGFSLPEFENFFNGSSFFESLGFPIDSMFAGAFPFGSDLFSSFFSDSLHQLNHNFAFPNDSIEFEDFINNYIQNNSLPPRNIKQQEELDAILKKHQEELEELMRKWEEVNRDEEK